MPTVVKFKVAKPILKSRLTDEIRAWVLETLEESPVSYSSFLGTVRVKRASFYRSFRKKMTDRRLWEALKSVLAQERFDQLVIREFNRQQRLASDAAQFSLPGFEHLPRRVSSGRSTVRFEQLTVAQFRLFADAYDKRTRKSLIVCEELNRLKDMIRNQPEDLKVPEAVGRASNPVNVERSQPDARAKSR